MQKSKINSLFVVPLILALIFSFFASSVGMSFAKQDGNLGAGNQAKAQNIEQENEDATSTKDVEQENDNDDEESSSTDAAQKQEREDDEIDVEEHRSVVSNFIHGLLDVADREGGIGEQVRVIAREQNQSASTTTKAIERVQTRSKIKTFFFGSDYKNLGTLRSEIVQTKNRLDQLDRLIENAQTAVDKTELQNQAKVLEQEQQKIDAFLKANENKFSLFGWFTKLFY